MVDVEPDPLAVTTPDDDPETSGVSQSSRVQIGTGHSGIASPSDVLSAALPTEERPFLAFDAASPEEEATAAVEARSGSRAVTDAGPSGDDGKAADEWRDIIAGVRDDMPSESVGFGGFVGGAEAIDPTIADSYHGDSQGIGESQGEPIDLGALATAAPSFVPSGTIVKSAPSRGDKRGGMGQIIGVVLGGVLAIPVTLAILLFGFQRDPFQITPRVPVGLRFLLPSRFRSVGVERRVEGVARAPGGMTLDQLPTSRSAESEPIVSGGASIAAASGDPLTAEPGEPKVAASEPVEELVAGLPDRGGADSLDHVDIVVEPVTMEHEPATVSPPPENAGIDLSHVDTAVAAAIAATEGLGEQTVGGDPSAHDQALVGWYRRLSLFADELAKAERGAIETGRPVSEVVDRVTELGRRLSGGRLDDLDLLGTMWLASEKRPSDGAILLATLEVAHPVGPWWGGRFTVGGENPRALSFLARSAPRAQPGQRVIVIGVLGDAGTIWAVDIGAVPDQSGTADGDGGEPPF